jgi:hypothetical protein
MTGIISKKTRVREPVQEYTPSATGRTFSVALPYIAVIIAWLIFSAPYLFRSQVPFPSKYLVSFFPPWNATHAMPVKNNAMPDVITQIYPWKKLTIDTWKSGSVPLWNPYAFSGTVHAANYQSAVFSPLNLLFFVLPFIDAWSLLILLQPLLAGVFMVAFMKKQGISGAGSVVSGLSFMFSGFLVSWMAYGTLGYALLYLPMVLYMIEKYRDGWKYAPLGISGGVALSFLSGHFQISLYVFSASLLYCAIRYLVLPKHNRRTVLFSVLYLFLGLFVASVQLIPAFEAYTMSSRSGSFVKGEVIPWKYLVTLFSPDYFGNPVTRNDWFGHYAEWNGYAGVIPLLLSWSAVFFIRDSRKTYFMVLAALAILFSYQSPVTDTLFFLKIPVVSTSAASRIMSLFTFAVSALAGIGFDGMFKNGRTPGKRTLIGVVISVFFILTAAWVMTAIPSFLSADQISIARRNLILPSMMAVLYVMITVVSLPGKRLLPALTMIVLIAVGADMYRFAGKWMPFDPREYMFPDTTLTAYLSSNAGNSRVYGNFGNELSGTFRLQGIEGYDAMYQDRYGQFLHAVSSGVPMAGARSVALLDKTGTHTDKAVSLLGVGYFVHRKSDGRNVWAFPHWEYGESMQRVYEDPHYEVFRYMDAYPRTFLASSFIQASSETDIVRHMFEDDTDLRETVIMEGIPDPLPAPGDGSAVIETYLPGKVVIRTESSSPKLLFLSDAYHTGWSVTVDGVRQNILRADYAFRAVALGPGIHTVIFRFIPFSFVSGIVISVSALLALTIITIRRRTVRLR